MMSVSDEIKLRAEVAATILTSGQISRVSKAIEFADMIVDSAIKKSLNIEKSK